MPSHYWTFLLVAFSGWAYWYFLTRKSLFSAALIQAIGYPLWQSWSFPIFSSTSMFGHVTVSLCNVIAISLIVESVRKGLFNRLKIHTGEAKYARLILLLFALCVFNSLRIGADLYSTPLMSLINRFSYEVLPACILSLTLYREERLTMMNKALIFSGICTVIYIVVGVSSLLSGITGMDLRIVVFMRVSIVDSALIAVWLFMLSIYIPDKTSAESGKKMITNNVYALSLVLVLALAFLSATRTFLLMIPAIIIASMVFPPIRNNFSILSFRIRLIYVVILCLIFGAILATQMGGIAENPYQYTVDRLEGFGSKDISTGRVESWEEALVLFPNSPILGVGESNSGPICYLKDDETGLWIPFRSDLHSMYLRYLLENGLIGGLFLAFIIISFLVKVKQLRLKSGLDYESLNIARLGFTAGIAGLVFGIFSNASMFFIGAGILCGALNQSQESREM